MMLCFAVTFQRVASKSGVADVQIRGRW